MGNTTGIDMGNSFEFISRPFHTYVMERTFGGGATVAVCEVGLEGHKHVAVVSAFWNEPQSGYKWWRDSSGKGLAVCEVGLAGRIVRRRQISLEWFVRIRVCGGDIEAGAAGNWQRECAKNIPSKAVPVPGPWASGCGE